MRSWLRSVGAVVAGSGVWTVLWLVTNGVLAALFPAVWGPGVRLANPLILLLIIGYSVVFSVLAGWVTAWVAGRREAAHAAALGVLQTAFGLAVTAGIYDTAPLWYHGVFVALLLPGNVLGARLRLRQKAGTLSPRGGDARPAG